MAEIECSKGHKTALIIQSMKFEVLLESGANALEAGFTMEAAASFAAALERFYEFFIQVILVHRNVSLALYQSMFKHMANQSERQVGAFFALHVLEFGTVYVPDNEQIKFRNKVVHKGHIPTLVDAMGYCSWVYEEIARLADLLINRCEDAVLQVIGADLKARYAKAPNGIVRSTYAANRMFALSNKGQKLAFDQAFNQFIDSKRLLAEALRNSRDIQSTSA